MSDEKAAAVDPRFDPAFQRGFDPTTPVEEYVPPIVAAPVSTPASAPAPAPVPEYVVVPPHSAQVGGAAAADAAGADDAAFRDESPIASIDGPAVPVAAAPTPARNPFLLALALVAIVLVGGGVWVFMEAGVAFNSNEVRTTDDYMSLDAIIHTAPFIALLGIATAIGVLFVFAGRYRRKR